MKLVLSLIANPSSKSITSALLDDVLKLAGPFAENPVTELAPGEAYDIALADHPRPEFVSCLTDIAFEANVDANIISTENRRKALLIADMDSTIIEQECIDELADYAGKRAEISAITERTMRGELDFEGALNERVAMLAGLSEGVLQEAFDERITLTPGALTLIKTMNKNGAVTALVSGGFTFFTSRIAKRVGFVHQQANKLLIENGALTGKVKQPILGRAAKQEALERLAGENNIALSDADAASAG